MKRKLSLIPEQGPFHVFHVFHVFLNIQEDVVKIYHFILATVYKNIFGSDLPNKPKPFRINLLITAVFLGWLKRAFQDNFVRPYTRGYSEKDLSLVTGKAAEVLLRWLVGWKKFGQVETGTYMEHVYCMYMECHMSWSNA